MGISLLFSIIHSVDMITVTSELFHIVGTVSKKGYKPDKLPFFMRLQKHSTVKMVQSTLVISNPNGLSEPLRDIRTSKYQSCGSEEYIKSNNHI